MKQFLVWGCAFSAVAITGCSFSPALPDLLPPPPVPAATSAMIRGLVVSPARVAAGKTTDVRLAFDYEDLDADVGPKEAQVEVSTRVLAGNIRVDAAPMRVVGVVAQNSAHWGRQGIVTVARTLHVPAAAFGTLEMTLTLIDGAGQRSNTLAAVLEIDSATRGGGGVGASSGQCTLTDGNRHPITSIRVGRQVFLRVLDPDNNLSSQHQDRMRLAGSIQAGATGDVEDILWLLETGPDTGVFEGPVGGLLLTSQRSQPNDGVLSVYDGDTVIAFYRDPNGPGDICIAVAKVG